MSKRNSEPVSASFLDKEVSAWVEQDSKSNGAWNMFVVHTLKKMKLDYDVTMQYLANIKKEQFDFICEAIDEVVYHFQKTEMVELIESLYIKFYGEDRNTDFYNDNIKMLRKCVKND